MSDFGMCVTYRISVHEGETPIRPENGSVPGWVIQEANIRLFGLRDLVRQLRAEGYDNEAILIERE